MKSRYAPLFVEKPPASRLLAPFTRCPVCGGTTTITGFVSPSGRRQLSSVCYSCDTRWDLEGNCIQDGAVVHLPLVNNLTLPEADVECNFAVKPVRKRRGVPLGAPAKE